MQETSPPADDAPPDVTVIGDDTPWVSEGPLGNPVFQRWGQVITVPTRHSALTRVTFRGVRGDKGPFAVTLHVQEWGGDGPIGPDLFSGCLHDLSDEGLFRVVSLLPAPLPLVPNRQYALYLQVDLRNSVGTVTLGTSYVKGAVGTDYPGGYSVFQAIPPRGTTPWIVTWRSPRRSYPAPRQRRQNRDGRKRGAIRYRTAP